MYSSLQGCHTKRTHMPHWITQCYLPPGRDDIPALTPAEAGTRLSDPGGMQGWVDLVGLLQVLTGPWRALTSFIRRTPLTTTPRRQITAILPYRSRWKGGLDPHIVLSTLFSDKQWPKKAKMSDICLTADVKAEILHWQMPRKPFKDRTKSNGETRGNEKQRTCNRNLCNLLFKQLAVGAVTKGSE